MIGRECDLVVTLWVSYLLCLCSVSYVYVIVVLGEGCKEVESWEEEGLRVRYLWL